MEGPTVPRGTDRCGRGVWWGRNNYSDPDTRGFGVKGEPVTSPTDYDRNVVRVVSCKPEESHHLYND